MALRNYLYAKHSDAAQSTLINKSDDTTMTPKFPRRIKHERKSVSNAEISCPPERQIVLEDGAKQCANCADCPKKLHDGNPKIRVQIADELATNVAKMSVDDPVQ